MLRPPHSTHWRPFWSLPSRSSCRPAGAECVTVFYEITYLARNLVKVPAEELKSPLPSVFGCLLVVDFRAVIVEESVIHSGIDVELIVLSEPHQFPLEIPDGCNSYKTISLGIQTQHRTSQGGQIRLNFGVPAVKNHAG